MKPSPANPSGISPAWRPIKELPREKRPIRTITLTPGQPARVIDIGREEQIHVSLAGQHYLLSRNGTDIKVEDLANGVDYSAEKISLRCFKVEKLPNFDFAVWVSARVNSAGELGPETEATIRDYLKTARLGTMQVLDQDQTEAEVAIPEEGGVDVFARKGLYRACQWADGILLFNANSETFHFVAEESGELPLGGLRFQAKEQDDGTILLRISARPKEPDPPAQVIILTAERPSLLVTIELHETILVMVGEQEYAVKLKENTVDIADRKKGSEISLGRANLKMGGKAGELRVKKEGDQFRLSIAETAAKTLGYPVIVFNNTNTQQAFSFNVGQGVILQTGNQSYLLIRLQDGDYYLRSQTEEDSPWRRVEERQTIDDLVAPTSQKNLNEKLVVARNGQITVSVQNQMVSPQRAAVPRPAPKPLIEQPVILGYDGKPINSTHYMQLRKVTELQHGDYFPGHKFDLDNPRTWNRELIALNLGPMSTMAGFLHEAEQVALHRGATTPQELARQIYDCMMAYFPKASEYGRVDLEAFAVFGNYHQQVVKRLCEAGYINSKGALQRKFAGQREGFGQDLLLSPQWLDLVFNILEEDYVPQCDAGQQATIGLYLSKGGVCRHRAPALQAAFQHVNHKLASLGKTGLRINSRPMRVDVRNDRYSHALVEIDFHGDGEFSFVADPTQNFFGEVRIQPDGYSYFVNRFEMARMPGGYTVWRPRWGQGRLLQG